VPVFITEGMQLRIPVGGLTLGLDASGGMTSSLVLEVRIDFWPYWLDIGLEHATQAAAERQRLIGRNDAMPADIASALGAECRAGMVAVVAAAITLDALYATVRQLGRNEQLEARWANARTPRHARISETLRRQFTTSNDQARRLHTMVQELFKFRDWAVHPPADFKQPVLHDDLGQGVEWRFVAFGAPNAAKAVRNSALIIQHCIDHPRPGSTAAWCEAARSTFAPRWERVTAQLAVDGDAPDQPTQTVARNDAGAA
jgi:hypothetical protein